MGPWYTLGYVLAAVVLIILLAWLAGCCRSRKSRPGHEPDEEESALETARRRYEAGEISKNEFQEVRQRAVRHSRE
jgi:uncharacterized membrane protein